MSESARTPPGPEISSKRYVVVALPVVVAVLLNVAYFICAARLRQADAEIRRTYVAKAEVQALVADLSRAEGGVGAYMVTRDSTFLEPLDRASQLMATRENRLDVVFGDLPHVAELRQLIAAAGARLTALEVIREDLKVRGEVSASSVSASRSEMQALQAIASTMMQQQDDLLTEQRGAAGVLANLAMGTALAAAFAGVISSVITAVTMSHRPGVRGAEDSRCAAAPSAPNVKMAGSVLIVDDDVRIRQLLHRWLVPQGLELREAADAQAAVALIAERAPSVILCDVHMPGQDGLWLAERVRTIAPSTAVVLATGDSGVSPYESLRKGVVAYVLKPFVRDQVLAAVQRGLRWSEQQAREGRREEQEPSTQHLTGRTV